MVLAREIIMKESRIETMKAWLDPKYIREIQLFLGFGKFY